FEAGMIERMVENLRTLLENIVACPTSRLSSLGVLSEAEQRRLLVEWNDTTMNGSGVACLQQLFEQQARQRPAAVAVVGKEGEITYGELNARASRLGGQLNRLGVGPEVRVGVCLGR